MKDHVKSKLQAGNTVHLFIMHKIIVHKSHFV